MFRSLLLLAAFLFLSACAAPLPTYPAAPPEDILQSVASNFASIKTISGPCRVSLVSDEGDSISLTAAIVAESPDRLRLRAWKFDRAVFDVTIIGSEVWLVHFDSPDPGARPLPQLPSEQVARSMSLLSGKYFKDARIVTQTPSTIKVVGTTPDFASLECDIDRNTRTPRLFTFDSAHANPAPIATLRLDQYRLLQVQGIGEIAWPSRLFFARGPASITIHMDEITLNDTLPASAFKPPARAVKQP